MTIKTSLSDSRFQACSNSILCGHEHKSYAAAKTCGAGEFGLPFKIYERERVTGRILCEHYLP